MPISLPSCTATRTNADVTLNTRVNPKPCDPPPIRQHDGFKAVSAGGAHNCGIRTDDTITCWGHNGSGQADAIDRWLQS